MTLVATVLVPFGLDGSLDALHIETKERIWGGGAEWNLLRLLWCQL